MKCPFRINLYSESFTNKKSGHVSTDYVNENKLFADCYGDECRAYKNGNCLMFKEKNKDE